MWIICLRLVGRGDGSRDKRLCKTGKKGKGSSLFEDMMAVLVKHQFVVGRKRRGSRDNNNLCQKKKKEKKKENKGQRL